MRPYFKWINTCYMYCTVLSLASVVTKTITSIERRASTSDHVDARNFLFTHAFQSHIIKSERHE